MLLFEFRLDVAAYFATRVGVPMAGKTLADAIAFNTAHADEEMPFFAQDIFEQANGLLSDPNALQPGFGSSYTGALATDQQATVNGIDAALSMFHLDAIVAPTDNPAWPLTCCLVITSSLAAPVSPRQADIPSCKCLRARRSESRLG